MPSERPPSVDGLGAFGALARFLSEELPGIDDMLAEGLSAARRETTVQDALAQVADRARVATRRAMEVSSAAAEDQGIALAQLARATEAPEPTDKALTAKVVDSKKRPIPEAVCRLYSPSDRRLLRTFVTDHNGEFHIELPTKEIRGAVMEVDTGRSRSSIPLDRVRRPRLTIPVPDHNVAEVAADAPDGARDERIAHRLRAARRAAALAKVQAQEMEEVARTLDAWLEGLLATDDQAPG